VASVAWHRLRGIGCVASVARHRLRGAAIIGAAPKCTE